MELNIWAFAAAIEWGVICVLVYWNIKASDTINKQEGMIERLNLKIQRRDWILREEKALIEELEEQEQ
jgi:hypothetical protein